MITFKVTKYFKVLFYIIFLIFNFFIYIVHYMLNIFSGVSSEVDSSEVQSTKTGSPSIVSLSSYVS
jgi:hypothetical protein